jgi:hypothetical protein
MKPVMRSVLRFRFLGNLLIFNLVIFSIFLPVYLLIDFNKHFASDKPVSVTGKIYFALVTHSNAMSGDIVPKTDVARSIMAAHIMLTWAQLLFLFIERKVRGER